MVSFAVRTLALALSLLAVACAGRATKVEAPAPPRPPETALAWVPEDGTMVGRVALGPLRTSALWSLWQQMDREREIPSWVATDKVDVVTFGGKNEGEQGGSFVVALEGRFAPTEIADLAARDGVVAEPRGLVTLYRRSDGVWAQITPRLIVHATADRADALVARASLGPTEKVRETPLFKSLAERIGFERAHAAIVVEDPEGKGKATLDRRASRIGLGGLTRDAVRLGGALEVGSDYHVVAVEETPDEAKAKEVEETARRTIDQYAQNLIVRMLGAGAVLSALRVGSEGSFATVRGQVSEQTVRELLGRIGGAVKLGAAAGVTP